jgi:nitrogen regulatory protein P-II 1
MKLITAIVRPDTLDEVAKTVTNHGGRGMTATEVLGFGRQYGHLCADWHDDDDAALLPKARVDIVVTDDLADDLLAAIVKSAWTGQIGDGKIWVTPVESVIRVRTNEQDESAI